MQSQPRCLAIYPSAGSCAGACFGQYDSNTVRAPHPSPYQNFSIRTLSNDFGSLNSRSSPNDEHCTVIVVIRVATYRLLSSRSGCHPGSLAHHAPGSRRRSQRAMNASTYVGSQGGLGAVLHVPDGLRHLPRGCPFQFSIPQRRHRLKYAAGLRSHECRRCDDGCCEPDSCTTHIPRPTAPRRAIPRSASTGSQRDSMILTNSSLDMTIAVAAPDASHTLSLRPCGVCQ